MRDRNPALAEVLADFVTDRRVGESSRDYLFRLVLAVAEHIDAVDRALGECLTNWRLDRLSVIDRSILRLGATDILFLQDVPPRVSIQEGILLAEKYGTADSPRFINGVLDALMRQSLAHGTAPQGETR
jgi:N utilization substance protein B